MALSLALASLTGCLDATMSWKSSKKAADADASSPFGGTAQGSLSNSLEQSSPVSTASYRASRLGLRSVGQSGGGTTASFKVKGGLSHVQ